MFCSNCFYHFKNLIGNLRSADFINGSRCNLLFIQCIRKQLFQFFLQILHICSGLFYKILCCGSLDKLSFPLYLRSDPVQKCLLVLSSKFHDTAFILDSLIKPVPLIHFIFHENKACGIRHRFDVIGKLRRRIFEKA